jgi:hypothetical protein
MSRQGMVGGRVVVLGLALGVALVAGCGNEIITPVGGTWEYDDGQPAPLTIKVALNADGSVVETLTPSSPLTGSITVTGLTWSVSESTLSITGSPSCSGGFMDAGESRTAYLSGLARISAGDVCMYPLIPLNSALDPNSAPIPNGEKLQVVGTGCTYALSDDGSTLDLNGCVLPPEHFTTPAPRFSSTVDFTLHRVD